MLANHDNKNILFKIFTRMIANNYAKILVYYYLVIDYVIFGSYSRHSMLVFLKYNKILIYNKHQGNMTNT